MRIYNANPKHESPGARGRRCGDLHRENAGILQRFLEDGCRRFPIMIVLAIDNEDAKFFARFVGCVGGGSDRRDYNTAHGRDYGGSPMETHTAPMYVDSGLGTTLKSVR